MVSAHELDVDLTNNSATQVAQIDTNPAVLRIQATFPTITISWPVAATNFVLQSSAALSSPAGWQTLTAPPVINGTQKVVRLPITSGNQFYRLTRP